jgi:hypothetical protein
MLWSMRDFQMFTIGATDGDIGTVTDCYFDDRELHGALRRGRHGGVAVGTDGAPLADRPPRDGLGSTSASRPR